jgi:hypothetical protein
MESQQLERDLEEACEALRDTREKKDHDVLEAVAREKYTAQTTQVKLDASIQREEQMKFRLLDLET